MSKSLIQKKRLSKKAKRTNRRLMVDVLLTMWLHVRIVLDFVIDFIFGWFYSGKTVKIPGVSNKFVLESASNIAASIREKKRTCEEVVKAFIERAKEVNGIINAVVDQRYEEALQEAQQLDKDIAEGRITEEDFQKKPFLGVPFTTKETTSCAGLNFTFGMVSRQNVRAEEDADVVTAMKKAGAILIGNTNIPELNLWQEVRNNVYGQTLNPYDTTRTTGGSSGGEAALIASCGTAFGIGTDIGGSIRMPAFFCGVFGHKPTSYLVSTKGLTTRTGLEKHTMVVAGPMTRHAVDLTPLLKILVGSNVNKLKLDDPVDICQLRYFYVEESKDPKVSPISMELRELINRVVTHFGNEISDKNESVTCLEIPELQWSSRLWRYWMTQESNKFIVDIANGEPLNVFVEVFKKLVGRSQFSLAAIIKMLDDVVLPKEKEEWAQGVTASLRRKLLEELDKNGVLLFPSYTSTARYHYTAFLRPYNFSYWSIFNVLQFPVTQVPLGLSKDGLPVGIQVVAAPYNDHLCIAVAKHLEETFGGYVPPFQV